MGKKSDASSESRVNIRTKEFFQRLGVFILAMLAWIVFRAESLQVASNMIKSMILDLNPWILFDDSLFRLGLSWKECIVLLGSILVLYLVSRKQENGVRIRDYIASQNVVVRWLIYLVAVWVIWIFGTYGYGFAAKDFIYGGF